MIFVLILIFAAFYCLWATLIKPKSQPEADSPNSKQSAISEKALRLKNSLLLPQVNVIMTISLDKVLKHKMKFRNAFINF